MNRTAVPTSAYKVAIFAVTCVLLMGLLAVLVGNMSFEERRGFRAEFTDATGVVAGDRVRLNGVEVGRVTDVELDADRDDDTEDGAVAVVSFDVDREVPVLESAQLVLRYENLIGQRYLEIQQRPGGTRLEPGATFSADQTTPALSLTVLFNGFQPLFRALEPRQVNQVTRLIVQALQGEAGTYQQLMASTARLTTTLADKDAVIGQVVTNLGTVLRTVDERDRKLTDLIVSFRGLMTGLADDRRAIGRSLPGLADLLGESSRYLDQVRGPLAGSLVGLDRVAGNLDRDRRVLDASLRRLPFRMRQMARTGSYGTAFNYYACGMSLNLRLLGMDYLLESPGVAANERDTVCARGSTR